MKGDFTRLRRDTGTHDEAWLQQQGRVFLDSDANEERLARLRLLEQQNNDIIGIAGAPHPGTAYQIIPFSASLPGSPVDFAVGGGPGAAGHFYLGGILCRNEQTTSYRNQMPQDFPAPPPIPLPSVKAGPAYGVAFLEAHRRLVTYLQDDTLRESALQGPDTTTRLRTVSQVKVQMLDAAYEPNDLDCDHVVAHLPKRGGGTLSTKPPDPEDAADPCALPDDTSYSGRENRLYRVEVHHPGDVFGSKPKGFVLQSAAAKGDFELTVTTATGVLTDDELRALVGRRWDISEGQGASRKTEALLITGLTGAARLLLGAGLRRGYAAGATITEPSRSVPVTGTAGQSSLRVAPERRAEIDPSRPWFVRHANGYEAVEFTHAPDAQGNITLEAPLSAGFLGPAEVVPWATYKWSRTNAAFGVRVVSAALAGGTTTLRVDSLGRDETTTLRSGDVVELIDDEAELGLGHGALARVAGEPGADEAAFTIVIDVAVAPELRRDPVGRGLLLRRWDGEGRARQNFSAVNTPEMDLGDGVHIEFGGSDFRSGDYWWFNTRSVEGTIDTRTSALPDGIHRQRTPLAILTWSPETNGNVALVASSCVLVFDPLTQFPRPDKVVRVLGVTFQDVGVPTDLVNDSEVDIARLVQGISVSCTAPVDKRSVKEPTVHVTVDVPFPLNDADRALWGNSVVGYHPLVVAAETDVSSSPPSDNAITWKPRAAAVTWLRDQLFTRLNQGERVPARLTLKGNYIWATIGPDKERLYLDGDTFGTVSSPISSTTDLILPSGDRRKGGDFQMWFWLVDKVVARLKDVVLAAPTAVVGDVVNGTVLLTATATGNTVVSLSSSDPAKATLNAATVTVPQGSASAGFTVTAGQVSVDTTITITAQLGGEIKTAALVLKAAPLLRVKAVQVARYTTTPNEAGPAILRNVADLPQTQSVTLQGSAQPPNLIIVEFMDADVDFSSISNSTFVVVQHPQQAPDALVPATSFVQVGSNHVRWVGTLMGSYTVTLKGQLPTAIKSTRGRRLDGETKLPSGDGSEGGDFQFDLTVGYLKKIEGKELTTPAEKFLDKTDKRYEREEILTGLGFDPRRSIDDVKLDVARTIEVDTGFFKEEPLVEDLEVGRAFIQPRDRTISGDVVLAESELALNRDLSLHPDVTSDRRITDLPFDPDAPPDR